MHLRPLAAFLALGVLLGLLASAGAASPPPVAGEDGMVASVHALATRVGNDILRRGGNAVDAAVAVGYTLAVVYPAAGNLGGGGFMTIRFADGRTTFLDFREKAPLAATAGMFLDRAGNVMPKAGLLGYRAVAVPGSVAGLDLALRKYGSMSRRQVMAPAIALAEKGFKLDEADAAGLNEAAADFRKDPPSAAIFLNHGRPYRRGDILVQTDLAKVLRRIARQGADGFYRGPIAERIVAASRANGGLLSKADFAQYAVREMRPITCSYKGYVLYSAPPPSSGGVALCEMLNILDPYPLKDWGFNSAKTIHYMVEAMRHAYVDRNDDIGDPDFIENPVGRLLDKGYAAAIRAHIDPDKAGNSRDIGPGTPPHEGSETTHYSVVDKAGNAVAVTYSLNNFFGARVTPAGTGILLNDTMDDFSEKPGVPNIFGLVQGKADVIAPHKTPLSSMSPTVVTKDGKLVMVLGSAGGARIITIVLQTFLDVVDYGMTVQEAVDAPRFHHQWKPDKIFVEPFAISADTRAALERMGYTVTQQSPWGDAVAILLGGPALGKTVSGYCCFAGVDDRRAARY